MHFELHTLCSILFPSHSKLHTPHSTLHIPQSIQFRPHPHFATDFKSSKLFKNVMLCSFRHRHGKNATFHIFRTPRQCHALQLQLETRRMQRDTNKDTALRPPPHGPSSQKVQERLVTKQLNQAGLVVQFEGIRYPPVSCPPGGFWGYRSENRQRSR